MSTITTPVAVLIIHGVGSQQSTFADEMVAELTRRFKRELRQLPHPPPLIDNQLVCRAVHWAAILQQSQHRMWARLTAEHDLDFIKLRRYMIDFASDAVAYQITPSDRTVYDAVHRRVTDALTSLEDTPGITPTTPLAVVGHSLGTVIASNWIWDLQHRLQPATEQSTNETPLTCGETLARLFTLGSPIALWSLRYTQPPFGLPITIPSPHFRQHYPSAAFPDATGEWLNFYDEDDVIAYPLKPLNAAYHQMVTEDVAINVGGLLSSWNPLSHNGYWTDDDVTVPIARSLARLWAAINRQSTHHP